MRYHRTVVSTLNRIALACVLLSATACSITPAGSAPYISAPSGGYAADAGDLNALSTGTPIW